MRFLALNLTIALLVSTLLEPKLAIDMLKHIADHHCDTQIAHHHDDLGAADHHHHETSDEESKDPAPSEESHTHTISAATVALLPTRDSGRITHFFPVGTGLAGPALDHADGHPSGVLRPPINS